MRSKMFKILRSREIAANKNLRAKAEEIHFIKAKNNESSTSIKTNASSKSNRFNRDKVNQKEGA